MRVVFLGNNNFSTTVLEALYNSTHEVVGVVCSLDKPVGRGNRLEMCEVKKYALAHDIPVLQYKSVSKEGEADVKALNPDVLVTASFGQMLRENVLYLAKYGVINVHGSLLPKYRGATPVQTALFNGEKTTGVTIMQSDIGMDTGDILYQQEFDILDTDTALELFDRMANVGASALLKVLDDIDYYMANRQKQNDDQATNTHLIKDSRIDWTQDAKTIVNFIRGNNPYSMAYCMFRDAVFKVGFATECDNPDNIPAGEVMQANKAGLIVACGKGGVNLTRVQPAGKKMMPARDYLNGARVQLGEVMS